MKYDVALKKALVFDFDGVILDSDEYKIATFKSLFTKYPKFLDKIDQYNRANRSVSRYIKFAYIFNNILGIPYTQAIEDEIGVRYNSLLRDNLGKMPLVDGISSFLTQQKVPLFIATSAIPEEPDHILREKGINKYFKKIYSYPTPKWQALELIVEEMEIKAKDILFFGDALADYEAAQKIGTDFIARTKNHTKFPKGTKH